MSAAILLQKVAKTAGTAKVAGFNKAIKKISTAKGSVKNRLEATAHQVSFNKPGIRLIIVCSQITTAL